MFKFKYFSIIISIILSLASLKSPDCSAIPESKKGIHTRQPVFSQCLTDTHVAIILIHLGTHPARKDKFYDKLGTLIDELRRRRYQFGRF